MGLEGWLVVTGGALFVQSPFGTGLLFYLHGAEPGRPRSVAKRPARTFSVGDKKRICADAGVAYLAFSMPHRPLFSLCDPHGRLPQELCLPSALRLRHVLYRAWISLYRERIPTAYFTARSMKIRLISMRRAKTKKTGLLWKQKRWIKYLMMKWKTVLLISICPHWAS